MTSLHRVDGRLKNRPPPPPTIRGVAALVDEVTVRVWGVPLGSSALALRLLAGRLLFA